MTKLWLLTIVLASSGIHQEWFTDKYDCSEEMQLFEITTKQDLFSAVCQGPDGEEFRSITSQDIGP